MKILKTTLFFLLSLSACATAPASNLFRDMLGDYTLNGVGAEFFALQISGSTIPAGAIFNVNNAGDWSYDPTGTASTTYFVPERALTPERGIYRFAPNGKYFALMLLSRSTVLISTNTVSSADEVDFTFLQPIAIKN